MLNTNFPPWPCYSEEEGDAVRRVLLSNRVNQWTGDEVFSFEQEFAEWANTRYAIALANGTTAIDLALRGLDIGPGDEVVVTSRSFMASVSSVVTAGARPVFADVDRDSQNITVDTIEQVLTPRTRAILVVHLAGMPANMDEIGRLAKRRNLHVIEDCAQAHGARWNGQSVGSFGVVGAWSFCQDKIMTTGGEGGMVTTNDEALWRKMWSYKDHGKSRKAVFERKHPPGFRWVHDSFGTNWRLTEMQAAIGRIQLKRMGDWQRVRLSYAEKIWATCREQDWLRVPDLPNVVVHAAYKCYVFVRPERLRKDWSRDKIIDELVKLGIPAYQGSCSEVYLEKAFEGTDWVPESRLPVARELGDTSLMFLVHPTLTDEHIDAACQAIRSVNDKIFK